MEKVLVTGGSGFIGTNLIAYLLAHTDYHIINYDLQPMQDEIIANNPKVTYIAGDILDKEHFHEVFPDVTAIVHLAADTYVIDSIENPTYNFETNVIGTYNVLELAKEFQVPLVVNASTGGAILGNAPLPHHENIVPQPLSPYGASKAAAEAYCHAFAESYGMRTISLRFSNVYGIRSYHKGSVIAHFFKQILEQKPLTIYGDGSQLRDYVYVEDICFGIYLALKSNNAKGAIQLGSGQPVTLNQLLKLIQNIVNIELVASVNYVDFRAGETKDTYCDITKAKQILDYQPQTDLQMGLLKTWDWFKSFGYIGEKC